MKFPMMITQSCWILNIISVLQKHLRIKNPTKEVNGEEINAFTFIPDNSDEEEREKSEDYEAWCQVIRNALKPEDAEFIIKIALDEVTLEEYAKQHDLKRDTVYKRYQRARKKLKNYMLKHWSHLPLKNSFSLRK